VSVQPIRKVLVANRGEIAVRVMRTLREMGIASVAVYSDADRSALHVRMADEAIAIGPPPPRESYLVFEKILAAAKQCGADAIHPGYGFLSENEEFAGACAAAGVRFIGPPAEAMRVMGSKTAARAKMTAAGVPVVPGSEGAVADANAARAVAGSIGFPLLLKAAYGGGGKGMRVVRAAPDLDAAFRLATDEAASAFGRGDLFVERYVERPRHIEVQIFGDSHGNVIHLGERECSIQRRHQKLVEESPSVAVTPALRTEMGRTAVLAASAVGYVGAGTVEFLFEPGGRFYFLEMNTRLQVEHPVTELVTGLDLVREQIRVAEGRPLSIAQEDVVQRGWSIECRITAEDTERNFMPNAGTIRALRLPEGPGVRNDAGIYDGYTVPLFYDSLLAKLVVWAEDRPRAIARLARALDEYVIDGFATTLPFHRFVVRDAAFLAGDLSTAFVEERFAPARTQDSAETTAALAAAAALHYLRMHPKAGGANVAGATNGAASGALNGAAPHSNAWRRAARLASLRGSIG
jgi:acetyl-CoA carboxylase biotin carboxylase subunit